MNAVDMCTIADTRSGRLGSFIVLFFDECYRLSEECGG